MLAVAFAMNRYDGRPQPDH